MLDIETCVERIPECGCWLWVRGELHEGSVFTHGTTAPRAVWRALVGPIPPGACVLHKCGVRSCVRPDHLYLGDHTPHLARLAAAKKQSMTCKRGHLLVPENLAAHGGKRKCLTCARVANRKAQWRRRLRARRRDDIDCVVWSA
jgi:hypothetical protein